MASRLALRRLAALRCVASDAKMRRAKVKGKKRSKEPAKAIDFRKKIARKCTGATISERLTYVL
jgi:hypothetical protein